MDKFERRRLELLDLLKNRCDGDKAALASKLDCSYSYVSRMLYPVGKAGKKRIGDEMVDRISEAFGVVFGRQAKIEDQEDEIALSQHAKESHLERLDDEEMKLLQLFRHATKTGRLLIRSAAESAPKVGLRSTSGNES